MTTRDAGNAVGTQWTPSVAESPLSHEWFRARLDEFVRKCDATVAQILAEDAGADLHTAFELPPTADALLGPPPPRAARSHASAYDKATRALKARLAGEARAMEAAVEQGFATLAATERASATASREVRDLRALLAQLPPTSQPQPLSGGHSHAPSYGGSPHSSTNNNTAPAYPADAAVSLADEQRELRQLRDSMRGVDAQLAAAKAELARERQCLKDSCDTAVRCNITIGTGTSQSAFAKSPAL